MALTTDPFVVYSAGFTGRSVASYLRRRGCTIAAFIDQKAKAIGSLDGVRVLLPEEIGVEIDASRHTCILALHNHYVDIARVWQDLSQRGFGRLLTMVDFVSEFPEDQPDRYWLAAKPVYLRYRAEVRQVLGILEDSESRRIYQSVFEFRSTGDYSLAPAPTLRDQYHPSGLPRWDNPLRFVDCGAYTGDSIEELLGDGYSFAAIAAFEPDQANFSKLAGKFRNQPITNFPCGVSAGTKQVRFSSGLGAASRVAAEGDVVVQCTSLDQAVPNFSPTLIKMDIEGAEIDALIGAKSMIVNHRPSLAISIYHTPEQFFAIPLLLNSWNLGYKFFVRTHCFNSFDTILYAVMPPAVL